METLESLLAGHPFFEGLDDRHAELLAGCARNVRFEPGRLLGREGEPADTFFLIRHGRVAVDIHGPGSSITIETIGPGEVVGFSWLFAPYRWRFDVRAVELTRAVALDGGCLRAKCEADHELGYQLVRRFAGIVLERLQATRLQLLDVYGRAGVG